MSTGTGSEGGANNGSCCELAHALEMQEGLGVLFKNKGITHTEYVVMGAISDPPSGGSIPVALKD